MNDLQRMALGVVACGFEGGAPPENAPAFGGYVLFARNGTSVEQVRVVTDALRARYPGTPPPLIAIDQEGGRVARLRSGLERLPSAMALGAANDLELTTRAGEQTAFDLRRAGCTIDLAPVVDLALDPGNTVIGTRSFGADPKHVTAHAKAFAEGLARGGVQACFKHFPGHGSTSTDSHVELPVIELDEATFRQRDLEPFRAVAATAGAIMGAHVIVRALDERLPATLSPAIAGNLLRNELGFGGAFLSDCLEMAAVAKGTGTVDSAVAAIAAGADLAIISADTQRAIEAADAIADAVERGSLPIQRLQQAYDRVVGLRRKAVAAPLPIESFPPHPGVGREIGRRAITLVRGFPEADPLTSIAVSFEIDPFDGAAQHVSRNAPSLQHEAPALQTLAVDGSAALVDADAIVKEIAGSGRRPLLLARRAHLYPAQARAIARIVDAFPDALVVSMLEPFDVAAFQNARHVLAAYGEDLSSIGGLSDVLFGRSMPQGTLPIEIAVGT